ncbi:hypothetical protein Dimus_009859 [Dionaea muscipula]
MGRCCVCFRLVRSSGRQSDTGVADKSSAGGRAAYRPPDRGRVTGSNKRPVLRLSETVSASTDVTGATLYSWGFDEGNGAGDDSPSPAAIELRMLSTHYHLSAIYGKSAF